MDIPRPVRRPRGEAILPMINVVFLLLIFFLMTAELAPPEPVAVAPRKPSVVLWLAQQFAFFGAGRGILLWR
ncbi:biopolymer transporter ExbD [Aquicoccus sp. G2-2]|uniref:biopolymer transporter ExbD n=1 Tax=Aquicoccus sp. G2-2 TaxID=3092120 RepID=UPI002AE0A12F|nr:biopolymer transporter ExbD [Aquicoccus sp. G2-2]MEA1114496.1 biopolymer transporter ExbD [Aquicoccus sp. G2-2]